MQKITGKEISIEQFCSMDSSKIRRILSVTAKHPIKIRRGDPGSLYKVRSLEYKRRNRALVSEIIEKYEESLQGI